LRERDKYRNGKMRHDCEEAVEENNFLWKDMEKWSAISRLHESGNQLPRTDSPV
jgi:hypothetical protein